MDMQFKKFVQRLFAVILCAAMLLPVFPQPAWAEENTVTNVISDDMVEALAAAPKPVNAQSVLSGLPYTGGAGSSLLEYDCGNGVTNDGAKSCIRIITGTTATQFRTYCSDTLAAKGLTLVYSKDIASNETDNNLFRKYKAADGSYSVYTYYLAGYDETRIIVDTNRDTVAGYSYELQTDADGNEITSVTPKMVVWGLSTAEKGYHIDGNKNYYTGKENNGSLIIIRMKDNSLFFHDGGILAQMSDDEADKLLAFCRELTGTTGTNKQMVINTWFVSHAHDDHFEAFARFIDIHHEHFDLKNVVYNIDLERCKVTDLGGTGTTPASKNLREALDIVMDYYPHAKYYKPHTGETFDVAGIKFDVMYTHEDRLQPAFNSAGAYELSFFTDTLSSNSIDIADIGGTYRSSVYKNATTKQTDFNDTSTVIRINFENDVDSILYADMNLAENVIKIMYPTSAMKTDIMMVPHHLFDSHTDLVKYANSRVYLCMQNKSPIYGSDNNYNTQDSDGSSRNDIRKNFAAMMTTLKNLGRVEGSNCDIFWGGSETVTMDINALGQLLGYSVSNRATTGSYYTKEEASSFTYGYWSINATSTNSSSVISKVENQLTVDKAVGVTTSTPEIVFVRVNGGYITQEGRYLIMSNDGQFIMSHDAMAVAQISDRNNEQYGSKTAGSITLDSDGNSENTFYIDANGNVIIDQSDRHFAIWNFRQYAQATGGTTLANGVNLMTSANTTFGGSAMYEGIELQKRMSNDASYWYSTYYADDVVASQDFNLRYFCFLSDSSPFKNYYRNSLQTVADASGNSKTANRVKFILDDLGNGTYMIYFRENTSDYRAVYCGTDGTWRVQRYKTGTSYLPSQMKGESRLKVRLYEYKETENKKTVAFAGYQKYYVAAGVSVSALKDAIAENITVFDVNHKNQHVPYDGTEVTAVSEKTGYYWLDFCDANPAATGEYPVYIMYRNDNGSDTTIGQVTLVVGEFSYSNVPTSGTVTKNTALTNNVVVINENKEADNLEFVYNGKNIDLTVGMLTDSNGRYVDTSVPGTYSGLTLTYNGTVLTKEFTLEVKDSIEAMDYPEYDDPGSVKVDKKGTTTEAQFATNGQANIQLSATAKPVDKGVDLIIIMDLSSSMRYHVNNSQYACGPMYNTDGSLNTKKASDYSTQTQQLTYVYNPEWWTHTRMYAMEEALKDIVEALQAKSEKGNVRIAMADFGDLDHYEFEDAVFDRTIGSPLGSKPYWDADRNDTGTLEYEMSNHLNFILGKDDIPIYGGLSQPYWLDQTKHNVGFSNANGHKYTGKILPKIYTGTNKLDETAFQDVDNLNMTTIIDDMRKMNGKRLGTNYDIGLETAYRLAYARQEANIAAGEGERDIVCIFMSDGAAMQYNYLSGRSQTEAWSKCIIGETDEILTSYVDRYVITSDPYDNSVYQNPYLQAILKDLLGIVKVGNLIKPGTTTTYPAASSYTGTDFFEAMKSIGVACDWELFLQIAYRLYTHHTTRTVTLADGTIMKYQNANATGENVLRALISNMRKPSFKRDANGNATTTQYQYQTYSPYYYFYNAEGKNWWAEAIKGATNEVFPVINRYAFEDCSEWGDVDFYYGEKRNNYSTGTGLALDGKDYVSGFRGLGLDLYTIGFSLGTENRIEYAETAKVLDNIASGVSYHYEASDATELTAALSSITSTMSSSASRAWFTDTLGDDYELSDDPTVVDSDGNLSSGNWIRVLEYSLDSNNARTGNPIVRETIYFKDLDSDGDMDAWSDQVYTIDESNNKIYSNIWNESTNVITGKFVTYNANVKTSTSSGAQNIAFGEQGTYSLPAETFFWTIGILGETEMVLEYQVYLTGSTENKLSYVRQYYDTNEEATLRYVNYLGNSCWLPTKTPAYPWGEGGTEDVIVVDYGIPVDIDVLSNDTFGTGYSLSGMSISDSLPSDTDVIDSSYKTSDVDTYGTIAKNGNLVRYTPKSMIFNGTDVFHYLAKKSSTAFYYGKVTVIPATIIYYEESFVTFATYKADGTKQTNTSVWGAATDNKTVYTQDQDRPSEDVNNALGDLDADNVYGHDPEYKEFSTYSLNNAMKATVNGDYYGTASFDFYGTGFDVISLSSKDTGSIVVQVYDYDAYAAYLKNPTGVTKPEAVYTDLVDTYYGYKYENGEWKVDSTESDTLYQVPVLKASGLTYDKYTAVLTISYHKFFDHPADGSYDFYLDAIRIYDPANDGEDDAVIENAYVKDDEGWPEYFELRNQLISKNDFDSINNSSTDTIPGIIFIDGFDALDDGNHNTDPDNDGIFTGKSAAVADYANFGPNNELYLAANQAIAFELSVSGYTDVKVVSVQLSVKSTNGSAYIKVYDASDDDATNVLVTGGTVSTKGASLVSTATDLYYDITSLNNKTVVIMNTGETAGILSITNIKVTYSADHEENINTGIFGTSTYAARIALASIEDLYASEGEVDPGEVVNGSIDIAGASLSFEDEILTNLYYTVTDVEATEMGLLTWATEPVDGTIDNAENVFAGAVYDADKDRYMVQTSGIAAKNLGDDIYMRVYAKTANGIVYSDMVTYSPKQYALSRLEKSTSESMKALCVAMLNYGAAAQEYFGYKTDDLMNAALTAGQQALATAYDASLFTGAVAADSSKIGSFAKTETGFTSRSAAVSFDGAFAINYYFAPDAAVLGEMLFYYWTAEDYADAELLTPENATGCVNMVATGDGSYWADISGIAAKQLDETFYVAAVYNDGSDSNYCTGVIAYSLSKYCMKNAVEGNPMKQLAEATAVYGYHASAYFAN